MASPTTPTLITLCQNHIADFANFAHLAKMLIIVVLAGLASNLAGAEASESDGNSGTQPAQSLSERRADIMAESLVMLLQQATHGPPRDHRVSSSLPLLIAVDREDLVHELIVVERASGSRISADYFAVIETLLSQASAQDSAGIIDLVQAESLLPIWLQRQPSDATRITALFSALDDLVVSEDTRMAGELVAQVLNATESIEAQRDLWQQWVAWLDRHHLDSLLLVSEPVVVASGRERAQAEAIWTAALPAAHPLRHLIRADQALHAMRQGWWSLADALIGEMINDRLAFPDQDDGELAFVIALDVVATAILHDLGPNDAAAERADLLRQLAAPAPSWARSLAWEQLLTRSPTGDQPLGREALNLLDAVIVAGAHADTPERSTAIGIQHAALRGDVAEIIRTAPDWPALLQALTIASRYHHGAGVVPLAETIDSVVAALPVDPVNDTPSHRRRLVTIAEALAISANPNQAALVEAIDLLHLTPPTTQAWWADVIALADLAGGDDHQATLLGMMIDHHRHLPHQARLAGRVIGHMLTHGHDEVALAIATGRHHPMIDRRWCRQRSDADLAGWLQRVSETKPLLAIDLAAAWLAAHTNE